MKEDNLINNLTDTNDDLNIKKILLGEAIKKLDDPFRNLTVKDVAKDLKMGENLTNALFRRKDFPSVNIGKQKTVTLLAYLIWKMDKKEELSKRNKQ